MNNNLDEILGIKTSEVKINPQLLNNDREHYQRFRIEARVQAILENSQKEFEWTKDLKIVALRTDNTYWIINGQHHAEAAIRLGVNEVTCKVFSSDGWHEEKNVFDKFQEWQKQARLNEEYRKARETE